ncbi:hypothetical protein ACFX1X_035500 [Malus domestica]
MRSQDWVVDVEWCGIAGGDVNCFWEWTATGCGDYKCKFNCGFANEICGCCCAIDGVCSCSCTSGTAALVDARHSVVKSNCLVDFLGATSEIVSLCSINRDRR